MSDAFDLRQRLSRIWEKPDFVSRLSDYVKRSPLRVPKGTLLFSEGDLLNKLYILLSGFIKLYRLSAEGRETTNYLLGPGHIIGVRTLMSRGEHAVHSAEAMTDVSAFSLSRKEYLDVVSQHPDMLIDLLHVFVDRLTYTERKLEGFIFADTTARVANFLADCARQFGTGAKQNEGKQHITLPITLTHQRIAEFVGSFRETVTVSLNRLEKEGVIKVSRGNVVIVDLARLSEHASIDKAAKL